jgi:hypothetical protein
MGIVYGVAPMAHKILRVSPGRFHLRDAAGKYTAFSIPTKKGEIWVSNKAVMSFVILGLSVAGTVSATSAQPLFGWALRLTTLN